MIRRTLNVALVLWAIPLLSCMPLLSGEELNLAGQEVRLTFLHTSDIHSRLLPFDFAPLKTDEDLGLVPAAGPFGGGTRLAAIVKRERLKADRLLYLDSGDSFQGAPIFNTRNGEAEFKFLSYIGLDAAVLGNHEFDAGAQNFSDQARDNATFPILAANFAWDDYRQASSNEAGRHTEPYTLRTVRGLKVAVIGMANISSLNSLYEGGNSLQATPLEQNEIARGYVELLKPVTDLIVVVSHLGLHEDQQLIQGYDAYYEYGRIGTFLDRPNDPWVIQQWFGPEGDPKSVVRVRIPGVSGVDVILGGHLHVVLNPPQLLTDPSGRKVVLAHSGAFAKYVGRLDVVVKIPALDEEAPERGEVVSSEFKVFPVDGLWCDDAARAFYKSQFWDNISEARANPQIAAAMAKCVSEEDRATTALLQPYVLEMDFALNLTSIFAYAPRDVTRRNNSTGGDSPLGNMATDSMRKRQRVEAELALTNTLGIRDNLYAGPVSQESMFNVFPFENTINIMYLSGSEIQEMLDFVTERSSGRGCQSQAQVSGVRFTMDCAQVALNDLRWPCDPARPVESLGSECPPENREGRSPWTCLNDVAGGRCWAHPATDIAISNKPLDLNGTYKIAVNDYIAKGGSGFAVLKRNTTRIETGISLRDSLVGYMQGFCTCDDILAGRTHSGSGVPCGLPLGGGIYEVDDNTRTFCESTQAFQDSLNKPVGLCTCAQVLAGDTAACQVPEITGALQQLCVDKAPSEFARACSCRDVVARNAAACMLPGATATADLTALAASCSVPSGPFIGRCSCGDAIANNTVACGFVTGQLRQMCENPTRIAIITGYEDGRIGRRVK